MLFWLWLTLTLCGLRFFRQPVLLVYFRLICPLQNVINRYIVIVRKAHQHGYRYLPRAPADCTPNILQFPAASCHGLSANHIIFEISYNSPLDNDTIRQHICQPNCAIVSQPPHRYNRFLKFHHIFSPARRGSSRRTGSCPRRARNL